jgi:hypothetical protein
MVIYIPFTFWAQDVNTISLKIDILNSQDYQLSLLMVAKFYSFMVREI